MTFTISQSELNKALGLCSKAVGNGLVLATGCYRLAMNKGLTVTACNMRVSISTKVEAKGDKCDILIPSHVKTWVSSLADQPLTFTVTALEEDYTVQIKSNTGNCDFVAYSAKDFPVIDIVAGHSVELTFEDVAEALYRTAYSKLTDTTGNILNAISVEIEADKATFVTYNGFAFARFVIPGTFEPCDLLLPDAVINALQGFTGNCTMTYSPKNICFTIGDIEIKSVLLDGKYIAYKHGLIIPEQTATCDRVMLIDAIKRVLLFSSQLDNLIQIQFSQLGIMVSGADTKLKNNAQERVVATCNGDMYIGLNGKMTIEALSHLSSQEIILSYNLPNTPVYIHEDLSSECLAMIAPIVV